MQRFQLTSVCIDCAKTFLYKDIERYYSITFMQASLLSLPAQPSPVVPSEPLHAEAALRAIQSGARYFFETGDFAQLVRRDPDSPAVKKALHRLVKQGLVVLATKRPAGWLIVPAEQAHYGAPPATWWLDDCLKRIEPHYYVALLSAARHWGSAHYAIQDTQVMVSKPRPALTPGKLKVNFFSKRAVAETPTVMVTSGVTPWRVSTREATLLDLIRHQPDIGGIENVVRITRDLSPKMALGGLTQSLNAMGQVPVAQRLGFIFDRLGMKRPAQRVADWLDSHRTMTHPLELQVPRDERSLVVDERWNIQYAPRLLDLFEEHF